MLDKQIMDFIALVEKNSGINVETIPSGTLMTMRTEGSTYHILFENSENGVIVLQDVAKKHFPEPWLCQLHGSTAGGSMVQVGWICFGARIRFEGIINGLLITRPVVPMGIELTNDEEVKARLRAVYDAYDALPVLTEEEWTSRIKVIIDDFPEEFREETARLIHEFCHDGQGTMLAFLARAHEAEKFKEGLAALRDQMAPHWSYRHPQIRGRLITHSDVEYINLLYAAVGLPPGLSSLH
ncbi:MAG: hypothetical protein WA082_00310 [Candidatus Moraniibacteriota bacterium]